MGAFSSLIGIIWAYISTIRILDILDIAIVAFVIYKVIRALRASASFRVIRGVLLIVVLLWLASILKLNVVSFVLGKAFEVGIIALVVIFQPELRRFLERVGSGKFTGILNRHSSSKEMEQVITQTVIACTDLSKTKTGALIVFEREIKLDAPIKTGTIINADFTSELVKNIFFPKAPLHDGAVIVRSGRVAAAGCMLPLSSNMNLSRDLGMRHRAGIGMSEQSDAVVVIVSEETGSISVAVSGTLKRHLAADTFEKLLRNELMPDKPETAKKIWNLKKNP